jgi:hypothetical protein
MRVLWDVYDNHNDADGDSYSANQQGHFAQMLNLLYQYPNGTGANQIDEPRNSDYTAITELDGRGSVSYTNNYNPYIYNGVGALGIDNCWPP